jgi:protein-S-isoprenylcysteine O-methyltransferase Ste14
MDRIFLIRALSLYLPLLGAIAAWKWRKPSRLEATGALLATAWNFSALLFLNFAAQFFGWWRFGAHGLPVLDLPLDLWLGWSVLWGALAALLFRKAPVWLTGMILALADLLLMPLCEPVVVLSRNWLVGEAFGLLICLVPGLLFARWTHDQIHVRRRAFMQFLCFSGLFVSMLLLLDRAFQLRLFTALTPVRAQIIGQLLFVVALPALSAVQEFAMIGRGTPLPFDPPRRLVTSGIYSYIANPMQTTNTLLLLALALAFHTFWLALTALVSLAYSAGLAAWDEGGDLKTRYGAPYRLYRRHVRDWLPRWRPYIAQPAWLYLSEECGKCSQMARFLRTLHPVGLEIVPAEEHPQRDLNRMTYESHDASIQDSGIAALARALEHVNFGWALLGMAMRLPFINSLLQAIADVSGGEPVLVRRRHCSLEPRSPAPSAPARP